MVAWKYKISPLVLKNVFQHLKRNFVSPAAMSYPLYKLIVITVNNDNENDNDND